MSGPFLLVLPYVKEITLDLHAVMPKFLVEKVSPISEIPAHHHDLVFQSNERMTLVLIKPSQLRGLKF